MKYFHRELVAAGDHFEFQRTTSNVGKQKSGDLIHGHGSKDLSRAQQRLLS